MPSGLTKVHSVRLELLFADALESCVEHHGTTVTSEMRRALIHWLRLTPIERDRLFHLELVMARADLRRIGGLVALTIKMRQPLPEQMADALEAALEAVKRAIDQDQKPLQIGAE